jgi:opacity protein-like surface antigen
MLRRLASLGAVWIVVTFAAATPAAAQARLIGGFAAAFAEEGVAPLGSIGLGYDFKPNFGIELEFGFLWDLSRRLHPPTILESVAPQIYPAPDFRPETRIVSFSANAVGRLGPEEHKLSPYVVLGGGTANVKREFAFTYLPYVTELIPLIGDRPTLLLPRIATEFSENAFTATVGGGLDINLTSRLAAGVDVRYQQVFSDTDGFGITRVGGRFTFRF